MPNLADAPTLMRTAGWVDYALIDSGGGRKLERFGSVRVIRPEPQCLWRPALAPEVWAAAEAVFEASDEEEAGRWRFARPLPDAWPMAWRDVRFLARPTAFRHLGLFPEHASNWGWIVERLTSGSPTKILNLFGYTGIASLVAAARGAMVTHVDASKKAIAWGKENADASGLAQAPVRWICEDARKWVEREARRGARYHAIILDPPKYGRGPAGEVWRLYEDLPGLVAGCAGLLEGGAGFLLLNAYSERLSSLALAGLVAEATVSLGGRIEFGELGLMEQHGERGIGLSFFARWSGAK
ncbi:MAG TPA: class I SAM-dependent methyltransferase [Caulobacteraceae bacterium]